MPNNFPGAGRRVYPGFLQYTGFVAMNPDRHTSSHYDYFKDLIKGDDTSAAAHRKFYDEYNAVLDMDADYYLETIRAVFQDFDLVNGTWDVKSPAGALERVRPQDIKTTAVLTVEGELDDISGSGQTEAAHELCSGVPTDQHKHLEAKGAGHYGIFSGRRWRDVVYPVVKRFITEHNGSVPSAAVVPEKATAAAAAPVPAQVVMEFPATPSPAPAAPAVAAVAVATPRVAAPAKAAPAKKATPVKKAAAPAKKVAPAAKKAAPAPAVAAPAAKKTRRSA